jgi:hypothetical protein
VYNKISNFFKRLSLDFIQPTTPESVDLKIIDLFYEFLDETKGKDHNTHVFLVSNDSDFQLISNRMKRYPKVKTHMMTSLFDESYLKAVVRIEITWSSVIEH